MSAPAVVRELVDRFPAKGTVSFLTLNETSVRREFLDPLFGALGWDIDNTKGNPADYKEVIHEDKIRTHNKVRTPDYAFRLAGKRKFFVEAKRPTVRLREDPQPARQLRRYGWSAKLPLSIVTDFHEFCVYDCRREPRANDKADVALQFYVDYQEYEQQWDRLYGLFSKEAVLDGALDKYAEESGVVKGTKTVDRAFLAEMQSWRLLLAKNIAQRNPSLSDAALNYAVQMTLDRLLFLRVAEDRGIEPFEQLKLLVGQSEPYARLCRLFRDADDRYNSGLFHFAIERGRLSPQDDLTLGLTIDDKPLREIVEHLYYPYPYEFGMIPVEIMGQVYEQFLGQVIHVDANRKVHLEDKPEVRKAGGVFYTPQFIVDYIVDKVLGSILETKTPREVSKLRVLDAACGSGSFLVGAYRYLLEWHRSRYIADGVPKHKQELYQDIYGDWQLTTAERKRILLNNIYGVDIDPYAVEVAKLSLLLVVLEGATEESLAMQLRFAHERALPDLDKNIKCGNSLVSPDHPQLRLLSEEERARVNPLDWEYEFPEVMSAGGFDVLVGNPPYIRIQGMKEWAPFEVDLYKQVYQSAGKGNYDKYALFVERGLNVLNDGGHLGYILPHKFFNAQYGEPLRKLISEGKYLYEVVHFGDQQVFTGATTYTALMFLNKRACDEVRFSKVDDLKSWLANGYACSGIMPVGRLGAGEWNFTVGNGAGLFDKLNNMPTKLGQVASIFVGLQTSADTVFLFKDVVRSGEPLTRVRSKALECEVELESALLRPVIRSGNIGRFWATPTALVLFPYKRSAKNAIGNGKMQLIPEAEMRQDFPRAWAYLEANRQILTEREHGRFALTGWYQLYPKNLDLWEQPKLMVPYMVRRLSAFYDEGGNYFVNVTTGGFGVTVDPSFGTLEYVAALLNSRVLDWYIRQVSTSFHGGYFAANKQYLVQLPLRPLDLSNVLDRELHAQVVELVQKITALYKQLEEQMTPDGKTRKQRQIAAIDRQLDQLIYDLYSLSAKEREVVENQGSRSDSPSRP